MSLVIGLGQLGGATKLARPLSSPENIIDKVGLGQVCKNVMARTIPWIKKKRLGDASVLAPHFSHLVVEAVFFLQTYPPLKLHNTTQHNTTQHNTTTHSPFLSSFSQQPDFFPYPSHFSHT